MKTMFPSRNGFCQWFLFLLVGLFLFFPLPSSADCPNPKTPKIITEGQGIIESTSYAPTNPGSVLSKCSCSWLVQCNTGEYVSLNSIEGCTGLISYHLERKTLNNLILDKNVVFTQNITQQALGMSWPVIFRKTELSVDFTIAQDSFPNRTGFRLAYSCLKKSAAKEFQYRNRSFPGLPYYGCPLASENFSAERDLIFSDLDGVRKSMPLFSARSCDYNIICPSKNMDIIINFTYLISTWIEARPLQLTTSELPGYDQVLPRLGSPEKLSAIFPFSRILIHVTHHPILTSFGLEIEYQCVPALVLPRPVNRNCSKSAPIVIRESSGVLKSDFDGTEMVFPMQQHECRWRIECNHETEFVSILNVSGNLGEPASHLAPKTSNMLTINQIRFALNLTQQAVATPFPIIMRTHLLDIHSIATTDLTNQHGWEFAYRCVNKEPYVNHTPYYGCPHTPLQLTSLNDTVMSDFDGVGPMKTFSGGNCHYNITCPRTDMNIELNMSSRISPWVEAKFYLRSSTLPGRVQYLPRLKDYGKISISSVLEMHTVEVIADLHPIVTSFGLSFQYRCIVSETPRPVGRECNSEAPVQISERRGVLKSDFDGAKSEFPLQPHRCIWNITCRDDEYVSITNVQGSMGLVTHHLQDKINNQLYVEGVRFGQNITQQTSEINWPRIYRKSSITIDSIAKGTQDLVRPDGWEVSFECVKSAPYIGIIPFYGCPNTPLLLTSLNDTVMSDYDGVGYGMQTYSWANCRYNITCPKVDMNIELSMSSLISSWIEADFFVLSAELPGVKQHLPRPTGKTPHNLTAVLEMSTIEIFAKLHGIVTSNGLELRYRCIAATDRRPVGRGCSYATPILVKNKRGIIKSDMDGKNGLFWLQQNCRWTVECESNEHVRIISVAGHLGVVDYHLKSKTSNRLVLNDVLWGIDISQQANLLKFPVDLRERTLNLTSVISDESRANHSGWELSYTCVKNTNDFVDHAAYFGCPSTPVTFRSLNDTIYSDYDGVRKGMQLYSFGFCRYVIACPSQRMDVNLIINASISTWTEAGFWHSDSNMMVSELPRIGNISLVTKNGSASILVKNHEITTSQGLTFTYACVGNKENMNECTIDGFCTGNAMAASVGKAGTCECTCKTGWAGDRCDRCSHGFDSRTGCSKLLTQRFSDSNESIGNTTVVADDDDAACPSWWCVFGQNTHVLNKSTSASSCSCQCQENVTGNRCDQCLPNWSWWSVPPCQHFFNRTIVGDEPSNLEETISNTQTQGILELTHTSTSHMVVSRSKTRDSSVIASPTVSTSKTSISPSQDAEAEVSTLSISRSEQLQSPKTKSIFINNPFPFQTKNRTLSFIPLLEKGEDINGTRDPPFLLAPMEQAIAEISSTVVGPAAAATALVGGSAAAADIQILGVLALVPCASRAVRASGQGPSKTLRPFAIGDGPLSFLFGLLVIVTGTAAFHFTTVVLFRAATKKTWKQATSKLRYPSLTMSVCSLALQGLMLESTVQFSSASTIPISVAVAVLLTVLAGSISVWFGQKKILPQAQPKEYFDAVMAKIPSPLQFLMPKIYWQPKHIKFQFGWLVNPFLEGKHWVTFIIIGRGALISVVATLKLPPGSACQAQFVALGAINAVFAVLIFYLRPYRSFATTVSTCVVNMANGVVLASPGISFLAQYASLLIFGATAISLIGGFLQMSVLSVEKFVLAKHESKLLKENGTNESDEEDGEGSDHQIPLLELPNRRNPLQC